MKRILLMLLIICLLLPCITLSVGATSETWSALDLAQIAVGMRAGGGSSGGGGGGGSSGGSSGHHHTGRGSSDPISMLIGLVLFLFVGSAAAIVFRFRLSRYGRNTRRLMKLLQAKDHAWKYKHMQARVREAFYAIQRAWTASDMTPARQYLSATLFESFQTKLSWMKIKGQRNVLERIRLIEAIPVSLHDDEDDVNDFVWFYIKGRMVDYTIDTETDEVVDGSTLSSSFVEYWQFTRMEGDHWALNQILQEDEADAIRFTEE
jgi:hypothetical protein